MGPWFRRWLEILLLGLLAAGVGRAEEPERQALTFDGTNQYLRLPTPIFNRLESATVEGWIRFDDFGFYTRFIDVGFPYHAITVAHAQTSPNLIFEAWANADRRAAIHVIGLLQAGEWQHLAIQCGPKGMALFFNGSLIASNAMPIGFSDLHAGTPDWLASFAPAWVGRSAWNEEGLLRGAVSDLRVWSRLRSQEEIARDLYAVPADAARLVGRWPLNGALTGLGGVADAEPGAPARFEAAALPPPERLAHPAIVRGVVRGPGGEAVDDALVLLTRRDETRPLAAGASGSLGDSAAGIAGRGRFIVAVFATNEPVQLTILHPSGRVTTPLGILTQGEMRSVEAALAPPSTPSGSGNSTNEFLLGVAAMNWDERPWIRQIALNTLARFPETPGCATLAASIHDLDMDPEVRRYAAGEMQRMAPRSTVAAVTLLESTAAMNGFTEKSVQDGLRRQPIPKRLQAVYARRTYATALLFAGILGAFTVLHSLFFVFDLRNRAAGYTALFTGVGALGVLLSERPAASDSFVGWLANTSLISSYLLALRLLYCLFDQKLPPRFWVLSWSIVGVGAAIWFTRVTPWIQRSLFAVAFLLVLATLVEMLRVVMAAWRAGKAGSRLVGLGFLAFAALQTLAPFGITNLVGEVAAAWVFPSGLSLFVLAAGIHLAREFVRTHQALASAHGEIARSQELLNAEIANAADYVRARLPEPISEGPVQVAWLFNPSTQLGGDSFGYHPLDADRHALYLLDVCGHGVSSALLSISALNVMRSHGLPHTDFGDPAAVLAALNRTFPMDAHNQQYFTVWYGVFDRRTRRLTYAAAGHPPAWLVFAENPPQPLHTVAPPIGCMPESIYRNGSVEVPGSSLLWIVSDGAFEVQSADGRSQTVEDFRRAMAAGRWSEPAEILEWAVKTAGGSQLEDDFSVLRVRLN